MYCKLNSTKLKFHRAVISIFLIISYMTTFLSCASTENYYKSPGNIDSVTSAEITKIELKNGTLIDCVDKVIKFESGADSVRLIVVKSYSKDENYNVYWSEKRIPEKDVRRIHLEKSEVNGTKTALIIMGITAVIIALTFAFKDLGKMNFRRN